MTKLYQALISLLLFSLPCTVASQNINGKVYDHETTVKGIKVYNISKKIKTYTDEKGNFTLAANVNDTLFFVSLFHHPKHVVVKDSYFDDIVVFELKKAVNELGEVLLVDTKTKEFNAIEYSEITGFSIANDIKNNPHLYMPKSSYSGGVNFIALAEMLGKLFKRKIKDKPIEYIEYKHLDSLFKNDDLFNLKLIKEDLNIPDEYANLFLDYCETKHMNKLLISEEQKVVLLDSIVKFSEEFLKITKEFEASKTTLFLKN